MLRSGNPPETLRENLVSLQVAIGIPDDDRLCARPIDERDLAPMTMVLAQLRGRLLSVAAGKFAEQLAVRLDRDASAAS